MKAIVDKEHRAFDALSLQRVEQPASKQTKAPGELPRALLMGAGWVINLAVAEWIIRRRPARPARAASAV